ncbi:MAG: hypothetical protein K0S76_2997, partial [Herbinix sp.]|nr:hypothetical protein [Herbinix sp.]
IFLDNMVAHVIPKSAFPSKSEAEEFHRLAIFLWDNNK